MTTLLSAADYSVTKRAEESLREMGRPMLYYEGDKASAENKLGLSH